MCWCTYFKIKELFRLLVWNRKIQSIYNKSDSQKKKKAATHCTSSEGRGFTRGGGGLAEAPPPPPITVCPPRSLSPFWMILRPAALWVISCGIWKHRRRSECVWKCVREQKTSQKTNRIYCMCVWALQCVCRCDSVCVCVCVCVC